MKNILFLFFLVFFINGCKEPVTKEVVIKKPVVIKEENKMLKYFSEKLHFKTTDSNRGKSLFSLGFEKYNKVDN